MNASDSREIACPRCSMTSASIASVVDRFANFTGTPAELTLAWPNSRMSRSPSARCTDGSVVPIAPTGFPTR